MDRRRMKAPELAGIRRSAFVEIGLLMGFFLTIDFLFFDGERFQSVSPHPYWLVVLLMAVQYGSREALLGATAATAALFAFNWPEQTIQQDYYDYVFDCLRLPFLWFVAAVLFGEIRMRHVGERRELRQALEASEAHAHTLAEAYEKLRGVNESLETQVACQLKTTTTMYRAAQAIDKLDPDEVIAGVKDIVTSILNPECFSVFLMREGMLDLAIQDGWPQDAHYRRRFDATSPLFQEVVGRQRLVCVTHEEDERILEEEGLVAAPLMTPDSGSVIGMLKIEQLGFLRLTSTSLQNLRVVSEWIATAYGKAARFRDAENDRVLDGETLLYSHCFLPRQTEYVSVLARRLGFHLSLVTLELENPEELSEEDLESVPAILRATVASVLRRTDLAFHQAESNHDYALLLPGTSLANARIVIGKLQAGLEERLTGTMQAARFSFRAEAVHEYQRPSLFQESLFPRQTEFLRDLSSRFGFALTMVVVRVDNPKELVDDDRTLLPGAINLFVSRLMPAATPAFTYQRDNWEFPIVLPTVGVDDARRLGRHLLELVTGYVRSRKSRARLSLTLDELAPRRPPRAARNVIHA